MGIYVPLCWEIAIVYVYRMKPMQMDDPAYPFLAFAGIPSISFHFISPKVSTNHRLIELIFNDHSTDSAGFLTERWSALVFVCSLTD